MFHPYLKMAAELSSKIYDLAAEGVPKSEAAEIVIKVIPGSMFSEGLISELRRAFSE